MSKFPNRAPSALCVFVPLWFLRYVTVASLAENLSTPKTGALAGDDPTLDWPCQDWQTSARSKDAGF